MNNGVRLIGLLYLMGCQAQAPDGVVPDGPQEQPTLQGVATPPALEHDTELEPWTPLAPGPKDPIVVGTTEELNCPPLPTLPPAGDSPPVQLSGAHDHTCVVRQDGRVLCWGYGAHGQLGDGLAMIRIAPVTAWGLENVVRVSAGGSPFWAKSHTCAVEADGSVWCWGNGLYGQIGNGADATMTIPTRVLGLSDAIDVSAGGGDTQDPYGQGHTCAVRAGGEVLCWGSGSYGQLGSLETQASNVPVSVPSVSDAVQVSAGGGHTCARTASGGVWCWGLNTQHQLGSTASTGEPTFVGEIGALEVAAGGPLRVEGVSESFTCALLNNGQVVCWGAGGAGQLGREIASSATPLPVLLGVDVVDIDSGTGDACAVTAAGSVWCWGVKYGVEPVELPGLADITQVEVGSRHICALSQSRGVVCTGDNYDGRLGDGVGTDVRFPSKVAEMDDAVSVTAAAQATCAIREDGTAWCWGRGPAIEATEPAPAQIIGVTDALSISSAGRNNGSGPGWGWWPFACALHETGQVSCWSWSEWVAQPVEGVTGASEVVVGVASSCARTDSGVVCWSDKKGSVAEAVELPGEATQLAVGDQHACALLSDGRIACWGGNWAGQLTGDDKPIGPVIAQGIADASHVAAGFSRTCAVRDGEVWCWGRISTSLNSKEPVKVDGISGAVSVAIGGNMTQGPGRQHACALLADGTLTCWGDGPLGDNLPATPMPGVEDAVELTSANGHTCVRRQGGEVFCWGLNQYGQLGSGTYPTADHWVDVAMDQAIGAPGRCPTDGVLALTTPDVGIITTGDRSTVSVSADGEVSVWGDTFVDGVQREPMALGLGGAVDVSVMSPLGCSVQTDGTVRCWGQKRMGTGANPSLYSNPIGMRPTAVPAVLDAVKIESSQWSTCALRASGQVACWPGPDGRDVAMTVPNLSDVVDFSIGRGLWTVHADGTVQHRLQVWDEPEPLVGMSDAVEVSASYTLTCVRDMDDGVFCGKPNEPWSQWFVNAAQISVGNFDACTRRNNGTVECEVQKDGARTVMPNLIDAVHLSARSGVHRCAIRATGERVCWGENVYGQLGTGITMEHTAPLMADVPPLKHIAAGLHVTVGAGVDGKMYWWGNLGQKVQPKPLAVVMPFAVDRVVAGAGRNLCALSPSGQVACIGMNADGQLASENKEIEKPLYIPLPASAVQLSLGLGHACAILKTGGVACWGSNTAGQLGYEGPSTIEPTVVEGITTTVSIATGGRHTCVALEDGSVDCWGQDNMGQLGTAAIDDAVQVLALAEVTCVLQSTGTVWCGGANDNGQLGKGLEPGPDSQTQVPGNIVRLSGNWQSNLHADYWPARAGSSRTQICAETEDGDTWCWGSAPNSATPTLAPVGGFVVAGAAHMCSLDDAGAVQCWGLNLHGALGEGSYPFAIDPRAVLEP